MRTTEELAFTETESGFEVRERIQSTEDERQTVAVRIYDNRLIEVLSLRGDDQPKMYAREIVRLDGLDARAARALARALDRTADQLDAATKATSDGSEV